jgi:hypothetical protein
MTEGRIWRGLPILDYDKLHKIIKENLTDTIRKFNVPLMKLQDGSLVPSEEKQLRSYNVQLVCYDKKDNVQLSVCNGDDFNFYGIITGEQTFFKTFFDAAYSDDELADILMYLYLRTVSYSSYTPLVEECKFRASVTYINAGGYYPHNNTKKVMPFIMDRELIHEMYAYGQIIRGDDVKENEIWTEEALGKHITQCMDNMMGRVDAYWIDEPSFNLCKEYSGRGRKR